jgi:AcrR family transcriptional regulator
VNRPVEIAASSEVALILAAERLFAERGIEAVALRHVNQAANQKNMSAAHYHFGSREGLVEAVLMHRLPSLDQRRRELLSKASAIKDMRFYLYAFISPLTDELRPRREGNYYIRFIQQYEKFRGNYEFVREISPAGVEIYTGLEGLLFYLPTEIRRLRIGYLINMIHSVLATVEERFERSELPLADIELICTNVIDMVMAALSSPLSAQTIHILSSRRPRPLLDNTL